MLKARNASLGLEMEPASGERAAYTPIGDTGTLIIAAVPIGQPGDASPRLAEALRTSRLIAAEDTRRVRRLAAALGVELTGRLVSYYDEVEARRVPSLLAELQDGRDVLLVTDAGMPGVSDPGYRLVAAAADAGIRVTALPGPSAVTTALADVRPAHRPVRVRGLPAAPCGRARPAVRGAGERAPGPWCSSSRRGAWPRRWRSWRRHSAPIGAPPCAGS